MAGHARFTALLDACVLFPIATCNALMSVAATGIFAAKWTAAIDDEWTRTLSVGERHRRGDAREAARCHACGVSRLGSPRAAWEPLASCLQLPDIDDRHVLAAAMAGHADCIVTANLKDFPSETRHRGASSGRVPAGAARTGAASRAACIQGHACTAPPSSGDACGVRGPPGPWRPGADRRLPAPGCWPHPARCAAHRRPPRAGPRRVAGLRRCRPAACHLTA